jgi:hypothetical protein
VAKMPGGCFPYFAGVLKAHRLPEGEVVAPVAQPQAVVPALYRDKGSSEKEEDSVFLPFLWYRSGVFFG